MGRYCQVLWFLLEPLFVLGRVSAQSADAFAEAYRLGARTGQGRQPRSGRA